MQCKYYRKLPGQTCERLLWRGGRFIQVVFKTGSTVFTTILNAKYNVFIAKSAKLRFVKDILKFFHKKSISMTG